MCFLILIYLSSYYLICVLIHYIPHTDMCPHTLYTSMCFLILMCPHTIWGHIHISAYTLTHNYQCAYIYHYICVLMLKCILLYICVLILTISAYTLTHSPLHTTIYVSLYWDAYCYMCPHTTIHRKVRALLCRQREEDMFTYIYVHTHMLIYIYVYIV